MVNILIAVDGQKLAQQVTDGSLSAGTQSNPTVLGSYASSDVYISMVAQNNFVTNDQGKSELTVTVNPGDSIRWAMTTFDSNMDHTAYLYGSGTFNGGDFSGINYLPLRSNSYLPSGSNSEGPVTEYHNEVYAAQGTVLSTGNIQYVLSFALIDNSNGSTIGYFSWDPFINVNS